VVVWGATGFTGRLVAEYLAKNYGAGGDLRWAIAGRSREKLTAVRDVLASIEPLAAELPILVGDSRDAASLAPIVSSTRVVATTVGPYAIHGHELAAACVEHGTDSVDLTGEPQFVRALIDRHHERAKQTGARIVNCCGFDSIPSDLGTLLLQTEMRARHGTRCAEVKCFAGEMRGGASGGTIASALNVAEEMSRDRSMRRLVANPYSLDPERTGPGPDGPDQKGVRWDADLGRWTGPFAMAAINARVVRRSNALLGYSYGQDFRYAECASFGAGPKGLLSATGMMLGLGAFIGLAAQGALSRAAGSGRRSLARGARAWVLRRASRRHRRVERSSAPARHRARRERPRLRRDGEDDFRVRRLFGEGRAAFGRRRPHSRVGDGHDARGAPPPCGHGLRGCAARVGASIVDASMEGTLGPTFRSSAGTMRRS
jgi:short subunit dehydrogenase-like uncharacterized protein